MSRVLLWVNIWIKVNKWRHTNPADEVWIRSVSVWVKGREEVDEECLLFCSHVYKCMSEWRNRLGWVEGEGFQVFPLRKRKGNVAWRARLLHEEFSLAPHGSESCSWWDKTIVFQIALCTLWLNHGSTDYSQLFKRKKTYSGKRENGSAASIQVFLGDTGALTVVVGTKHQKKERVLCHSSFFFYFLIKATKNPDQPVFTLSYEEKQSSAMIWG